MACLQVLKTSPQGCFRSDSGKRRLPWLQNFVLSGTVLHRRRLTVSCNGGDSQRNNGKEPPESLFSKELRRRGMTPESEKNKSASVREDDDGRLREEDGGWNSSRRNGVATNAADVSNQREKSMALNSEGLEGLIPRAKALLTLGATFFLAFWPLILVTVASFSALYLYLGPEFVHDGNGVPTAPPQYVDPYDLLEEQRIYETAPPIVN